MFGTSQPILAQQVLDPILEEERRRQLEQRTNELGTLERRGGAPDPGPAQARGGPCFQINRLTVEGVTLLSPAELAAITSKYVPNCMQGADIQAVMRELDAAYTDQGYITSKTYIPPQNLQDGELVLTMLEGMVEDILLIDAEEQIESRRGERQLKTAFPNAEGGLFQLRDFEQGLDQMNRLASVEAILKLQPGEEPGGSYVIVQRVQEDLLRGYARLDNQGSESTGRNKLSFDLEVDDLFGANDTWTLGYSGSENTNALSINGSVPYGYWTFETELAYSEYLTPLNALSELFGTSRTAGLKARYVAHRDQASTTELNFGLRVRKSDRFINDVRLTPQNLSTFSLGVKHLRLGEKARNSYDATLSFGTTLFGADKDAPGIGSDIPRAQFFKINAGWQRQGALGQTGTLVTDLRAQWSPHTLYGTEQLSLGSFSTVRGYEASVATGDMGVYMRNDLYLTPNIWTFLPEEAAGKVASKTQTHLFLDMGITRDHARDVTEKAAGFGLGLSYYHKRFTLSGTVGVPLIQDNRFDVGDPVVQLRMDVKTW
ncbi:ShlB/FhaC/HecB family hemolysin secretion/activation protein (plasmid) [Tritonibacter scottomollicae]|uniref:ShlB/FhaC/HecB family hemolysin secretion/activation protein n=1 Tax=Tritonibacter scottomollicae TaxID=483013 RepID=A0ABZ0HM84_TRISK|nr:ShlB/FhaC/HecB family hemolysin secretion/activation protein [Tritonibacter scottomollicae]WOI35376.1 ShlB/FhaC/HecB family hemolysin secretion/activation protein [Tritonibacter scottomollicae]